MNAHQSPTNEMEAAPAMTMIAPSCPSLTTTGYPTDSVTAADGSPSPSSVAASTWQNIRRATPPFASYNSNPIGLTVAEEDNSYPVLRLLYFWADSVMWRGFKLAWRKEALLAEDLMLLPSDEEAIEAYKAFKPRWEAEVRRVEEVRRTSDPHAEPWLFLTLIASYKWNVLLGAVGLAFSDATNFVAPFLLRELVNWLSDVVIDVDGSTNSYDGYIWAIGILINQFLISFSLNTSRFYTTKAFCQMKSSIAIAVFEKAARLEADNSLAGLAIQLHTTDSTKFVEMSMFFQQIWASTFLTTACLIALYFFVGWAGVLAICCVLLFVPLQAFATSQTAALRRRAMEWADQRLGAMGELLFGIRIVKFMGWEGPLSQRIAAIRAKELALYKYIYVWRSVMNILMSYQPPFISFGVFALAYAFGEPLTPKNVFPTMCMLNVLGIPMVMFPLSIGKLVDLKVSLTRIGRFLSAPEKVVYLQTGQQLGDNAITLEKVTCQYYEDEMQKKDVAAADDDDEANTSAVILRRDPAKARDIIANLNVSIPKHKLTIVVGATGCGKSTLVNAMIGEATVDAQSVVRHDGTVAFVPQESWMMNATVRDNILMGKAFDEKLYIQTVKACQLMADLKQLKASDMTEIGERGINVSGGQKQRVAFARAVYSDRDIIVMDDPLSAVDSHVATALFDQCVCGALDGKTRVLVTHHVQFLPRADNIIVMGDRCIEFTGTWDELMASGIDLSAKLAADGHDCADGSGGANLDDIEAALDKQQHQQREQTNGGSSRQHTHVSATDALLREDEHMLHLKEEEEEEMSRQAANDNADRIPSPKEDKLMTEETSKIGGIDGNAALWFYSSQGAVTVVLILITFSVWRGIGVVTDLIVSWWSTRSPMIGYADLEDIDYLQWFGIFAALQFVMLCVRQTPFVIASWRAAKAMHEAMINRLMKAPTSFYDTTPAGRIMARFSKDTETIDLVLPEALNYCYSVSMMVLGVFALVIYASRWFIILVVGVVIAYFSLWRYYSVTNRSQKRIESMSRSPLASIISQAMGGLATIRAYDCIDLFDVMHTKAVNLHSRATCSWRGTNRWVSMRVDVISCIVVLVVCMVTCSVVSGGSTVEERTDLLSVYSLAVTYTITISGSVSFLLTLATDVESFLNSAERCYEYAFEVPQERTITYGTGPDDHSPPPAGWPHAGAVSFANVSLQYAADKPFVLKNISLSVAPSEKVGIVGRTGSGKSTLMLALFRMVEIAEGSICFDGVDLQHVAMADVRQSLTIIPQDPMLFQGTIRSNLDPFDRATDEEVWAALGKVGMKERIDEDGRGLYAIVAERGSNFSVGQRQLLCLGRALLKKCKILLLDEATASVDFESDAMIQRTIRNEFQQCTVLTIAHRLATIIDSDKVLLMDHGVAAEYDSPAALLADEQSQFHSMVAALGPEQFNVLLALANERRAERSHHGDSNAPQPAVAHQGSTNEPITF